MHLNGKADGRIYLQTLASTPRCGTFDPDPDCRLWGKAEPEISRSDHQVPAGPAFDRAALPVARPLHRRPDASKPFVTKGAGSNVGYYSFGFN